MHAFPTAPLGIFMDDGNKPTPHGYGVNEGNPRADGLVFLSPFWENSGSQAQDIVNGNDGTLNGPIWAGSSLTYGVDGDTVVVNKNLGSTIGSISVLLRPNFSFSQDTVRGVFTSIGGGSGRRFRLTYDADFSSTRRWMFTYRGNFGNTITVDGPTFTSDTELKRGILQWITVTWDATTGDMLLYRDRDIIGSTSGTTASDWDGNVITSFNLGFLEAAESLLGQIDGVYKWDRVISASEVADLVENPYQLITPGSQVFAPAAAPAASVPPGTLSLLGMGV